MALNEPQTPRMNITGPRIASQDSDVVTDGISSDEDESEETKE